MRYEPHRLRPAFEALRRPFDASFNNAIDQVLLVLEPFEELESWVAELAERVKKLEDAKEEAQEEEKEEAEEGGEEEKE